MIELRNIIILLFSILLFSTIATSQQQFTIALDRANLSAINPANIDYDFFRKKYLYKLSLNYKDAWTGLKGAPRTMIIAGEQIRDRDKVSLIFGGQLYTDKVGRFTNNNASFRFGTVFTDNLFKRGLSVGLSFNLSQYQFNSANLSQNNLVTVSRYVENFTTYRPNIGMGIFYYQKLGRRYGTKNFFYSGLSAPLFYSISRKDESQNIYKSTIHLFYNGGYIKGLQDDLSFIEFSTFSKYESSGNIFDTDLRVRFNYRSNLNILAGFSTQGFFIFGAGVNFANKYEDVSFEINYTANMSSSGEVFRYFGALHEVTFSASFGR